MRKGDYARNVQTGRPIGIVTSITTAKEANTGIGHAIVEWEQDGERRGQAFWLSAIERDDEMMKIEKERRAKEMRERIGPIFKGESTGEVYNAATDWLESRGWDAKEYMIRTYIYLPRIRKEAPCYALIGVTS